MDEKTFSHRQKIIFSLTTFLILSSLFLGIGELFTRLFYQPDTPYVNLASLDKELGWRPHANYRLSQSIENYGGGSYQANYQTERDGFRRFGDVNSEQYKVFFIGDSYTQSVEVSNHQTFYSLLQDSLPIEVFAFGMAGYGNLQEYMIVEQYIDEIQPDLVILQVCDNDFMDNHYRLGREAYYVVKLERPFLGLDGNIRYLRPVSDWENLLTNSKFLSLLSGRFENFGSQFGASDTSRAEYQIYNHSDSYQPYQESKEITEQIIIRFRDLLQSRTVDFLAFTAYAFPPQVEDQQRMFEDLEIPFISYPAIKISYAKKMGEQVNAGDGFHWNPKGHQMMASGLLPYIQERIGQSPKAYLLMGNP